MGMFKKKVDGIEKGLEEHGAKAGKKRKEGKNKVRDTESANRMTSHWTIQGYRR
jgi:hypothetical protein